MKQTNLLGPWIKRFLTEHLIEEHNYSHNTQRSYRDTLCLLLPFISNCAGKSVENIMVEDVSKERVRAFLTDLETRRNCSEVTRNQRLATIRSMANYIGLNSPEHMEWSITIRVIPFKKTKHTEITYLEKEEMDALLNAPNLDTVLGRRDHAILLFMYNTGARAGEVSSIRLSDFYLPQEPNRDLASVTIHGKGNKERKCPLWKKTVNEIAQLNVNQESSGYVFINRSGKPLTRFGIHSLVKRYTKIAAEKAPSIVKKRVSPHTIRHTTATHLLRAGVDINTIRAWLGHVSINTTNIYAEIDLVMKANALASCEPQIAQNTKRWKDDKQLMKFLHSL